jgi:hypothetical protein
VLGVPMLKGQADRSCHHLPTRRLSRSRSVPLLREGVAIGVIVLTRASVQRFAAKQIELVTTW